MEERTTVLAVVCLCRRVVPEEILSGRKKFWKDKGQDDVAMQSAWKMNHVYVKKELTIF